MRIAVCVKRVPITGGRIVLTDDARSINTQHLGFTMSPHEECGVEEAVRLIEANKGESVVLTLGPAEAVEQLRDSMALGMDRAIHLQTDGAEWDAEATAAALLKLFVPTRRRMGRSTSSSSATSRPTREASRWESASRTRSAGRA